MADIVQARLAAFEPSKNEKHDPGQIVIFFDSRMSTTPDNQFSYLQSSRIASLHRLGWPSFTKPDLDPGMIRLVWYTHVGNEGQRDYPLYRAYAVKDMFDSLSEAGFRPMVLGWSGENPFPMIGGSEPPAEPKKPKVQVATTWSGKAVGHGKDAGTPHDRVMAIISDQERREAKVREKEVIDSAGPKEKSGLGVQSPV
ncbi:uncharacterized protein LTR77_010852 [Saxophila tyrrhenica]|uniref:Uncharacterized protein n=1 Tax=Saxophila tyrrhenica TaxID=1690608 RepID=A0AAV9NUS9_9PEZI|nr:hypothetical protein LTR77_010852 [Saxophila tyrrhenica]